MQIAECAIENQKQHRAESLPMLRLNFWQVNKARSLGFEKKLIPSVASTGKKSFQDLTPFFFFTTPQHAAN
jgi:hypothetical protein